MLDGVQNILRPRDQQPDNRDLFFGNRFDNPSRLDTAQQNGAASGEKTAEPVHFRAGVIKRRDTEKIILTRLLVVIHFHFAGEHQGAVRMKNRLGKTGGAGGKIYGGVILVGKLNFRSHRGTARRERVITFGKHGAVLPQKQPYFYVWNPLPDRLNSPRKLRTKNQYIAFGQVEAVFYFLFRIAVVERHGDGAGFQDAEINRQPLQTVHEQNSDLVPFLQTSAQ